MSFMNNKPGKERYVPINEHKYIGDINKIQIRSSYERVFCQWLDTNPNVVNWSSEITYIPYFDPVRNKIRRYFPDFLMKVTDKDGNYVTYVIEIKPYKQTHPPKKTVKKSRRTFTKEEMTWMTNQAKFKAANEYCRKRNWMFKIITEKEIFKNGYKRKN